MTAPLQDSGAPAAELRDRIVALIRDVLYVEVPAHDTDLIEDGLLDSLGLVSLITELEVDLGFQLPLDDLDIDTFRTVTRIAAFVESAQVAAG
jgi:acyl carrier protein